MCDWSLFFQFGQRAVQKTDFIMVNFIQHAIAELLELVLADLLAAYTTATRDIWADRWYFWHNLRTLNSFFWRTPVSTQFLLNSLFSN